MKVLLIETEKETIKGVKKLLRGIDQTIELVGITSSLETTAQWMKKNPPPDVILVNKKINTKGIKSPNGSIRATVTLSTPHIEYSFRALRSKTLARFFKSFKDLNPDEILADEPTDEFPVLLKDHAYKKRFLLKHGQRLVVIETNDISYFYSEGRFVFLITKNGQKYVTPFKLEELIALLNPSEFFRINRSWMISFPSVSQIHPYFGHRLKLQLKPQTDTEIIVSRERVNDFKAWLEE